MMKRSPGGAPSRPPSPLPGMRTRDPVSTPAGMRIFTVSVFGRVPLPLQREHGGRCLPVPSQSGHSWVNRRRPPALWTWPAPLQVEQIVTAPPVSPAPWQREHCSDRLTVRLVVRPVMASSKVSESGISMSAPRCGCGRGGSRSALAPPNKSAKMSRKLVPPPGVEVDVVPQSKPEKSNGVPPVYAGPAPRAAASARLSEY